MKRTYYVAVFALITCSLACNNTSTDKSNAPNTENATNTNTPPANQPEGLTLITKNDCGTCHNATAKIVGPSFTAIAEKYTNTPENISKLADEVIKGTSGVWGTVPMTPHPNLQKENLEKMVGYILSLRPNN